MAERFSIGRALEISFTFKPISDKDIIRDTQDLSDQPITGYGDTFN
jgi:hypothetical protein